MIAKGGQRTDGGDLADYLEREGSYANDNEADEYIGLGEFRGVVSSDLRGAVAEIEALSAHTNVRLPFWHCTINPDPRERMTEADWAKAWEIYERVHGLEGSAFAEVWHRKDGRLHPHRVYAVVDAQGQTIKFSWSKIADERASRLMEHALGHRITHGPHNALVMKHLAKSAHPADLACLEWMQAQDAAAKAPRKEPKKLTDAQVRADVLAAFTAADSGAAFRAALAEKGYILARGDRDAFMVIAPGRPRGEEEYELARTLRAARKAEGIAQPKKEIKAEIAARLSDLDPKSLPTAADALHQVHQAKAAERAAERDAPAALPMQDGAPAPDANAEAADVAAAILEDIARERATFTDGDLERAAGKVTNDEDERAAILEAIHARGDVLTVALDEDGQRRMTTLAMLETETGMLDAAAALAGRSRLAVDVDTIEAELAAFRAEFRERSDEGFDLNAEQIDGIRHLTAGADFATLTGIAGAGKSTLLEGAARVWSAEGLRVHGMALSGVAASRLGEVGIEARTIQSFLLRADTQARLERVRATGELDEQSRAMFADRLAWWRDAAARDGKDVRDIEAMHAAILDARTVAELDRNTAGWLARTIDRELADRLDARSVIVLDEAGMVDHRTMRRVIEHAERAGAKLVLVGDPEQLQPIQAGAAFRILTQRVAQAAELRDVIRQREAWQREATKAFAAGTSEAAAAAVHAYAERGAVRAGIVGLEQSTAAQIREAEAALGRPLDGEDRARIEVLARYMSGRVEAGALWHEIQADGGAPEEHPQGAAFRAAQDRRALAAREIAGDLEGFRPWSSRYGVDARGLAADILAAQGKPRAAAEAGAAREAAALGIDQLPPADCKLSFDWRAGARAELFRDWTADLDRDGAAVHRIILAYRRADVARLNADARQAMRDRGHLAGPDITITTEHEGERADMAVAIGDRLMCLRNSRALGVSNGTTGTVRGIEQDEDGRTVLRVELDDGGRHVAIDPADYTDLAHAYAMTIHKSQGVTAARSWLLADRLMDRHLGYVGMSRHKEFARVFAAMQDAPTAQALARTFSRARSKDAISDYIDARRLMRDPAAALAERRQQIGAAAAQVRALGHRLSAAVSARIATASAQVDRAAGTAEKAASTAKTSEMVARLKARGYTRGQVRGMTPVEARNILSAAPRERAEAERAFAERWRDLHRDRPAPTAPRSSQADVPLNQPKESARDPASRARTERAVERAARQFDFAEPFQGSEAETLRDLRDLSSLHVARDADGGAVLLPNHAAVELDQQEAPAPDALRRSGAGPAELTPGVRAGDLVTVTPPKGKAFEGMAESTHGRRLVVRLADGTSRRVDPSAATVARQVEPPHVAQHHRAGYGTDRQQKQILLRARAELVKEVGAERLVLSRDNGAWSLQIRGATPSLDRAAAAAVARQTAIKIHAAEVARRPRPPGQDEQQDGLAVEARRLGYVADGLSDGDLRRLLAADRAAADAVAEFQDGLRPERNAAAVDYSYDDHLNAIEDATYEAERYGAVSGSDRGAGDAGASEHGQTSTLAGPDAGAAGAGEGPRIAGHAGRDRPGTVGDSLTAADRFTTLYDRYRALQRSLEGSVTERAAIRAELVQLARDLPAADLATAPEATRRAHAIFASEATQDRDSTSTREQE